MNFSMLHSGTIYAAKTGTPSFGMWPAISCVNGWLLEMNVGIMPDFALHDITFRGMSVESVYDRLCQDIRYYTKLDPKDCATGTRRGWDTLEGGELDGYYRSALYKGWSITPVRDGASCPQVWWKRSMPSADRRFPGTWSWRSGLTNSLPPWRNTGVTPASAGGRAPRRRFPALPGERNRISNTSALRRCAGYLRLHG